MAMIERAGLAAVSRPRCASWSPRALGLAGAAFATIALLLVAGCGSDARTQIVVVVETDMQVPEEIDRVDIAVTSPDGEEQSSRAELGAGEPGLPRTLGLVHRGGPLGPYDIHAAGRDGTDTVVQRRATVSFRRGETLMLPMYLQRACAPICPELGDGDLEPWEGSPRPLDGGTMPPEDGGGPGCTPSEERCNGEDDDCDEKVDEDFDFDTDPAHCGGCGNPCDFANATGECVGGECTIDSCEEPFADCDGDGSNGCETNTNNDAENCGDCGNRCTPPRCSEGRCARP